MTKLASIRLDGGPRAARVDGDRVTVLPYADVGELLRSGPDWELRAQTEGESDFALADVELAPVIPVPEKIFCVGLNYADHAAEAKRDLPAYPQLFGKFARALIGARDDVTLPAISQSVDWEAELGLVIGRPARRVSEAEALEHVAGYVVVNDVSVRDWQRRTTQYLQGKTFEGTTPIGPWLTTTDEVGDAGELRITCRVDDATVQDISTKDMIFSPAQLVAYISQIITLMPGDVIMTGTGAGVGVARTPPRFLTPGCSLVTSIEGLGTLENTCVAEPVRLVAAS